MVMIPAPMRLTAMGELAVRPATTRLRCPRCKSRTFTLIETCEHFTSFYVVDGKLDRQEGFHDVDGYTRLEADCPCGHRWKVRNAIQINDAVTEEPPHDS
jgi:phage FluMu protein Com